MLAKILLSQPVTLVQRFDQDIGLENVVPHRGEGTGWMLRHRGGVVGLLAEAVDRPVSGGVNDAEGRGYPDGHRQRRDG